MCGIPTCPDGLLAKSRTCLLGLCNHGPTPQIMELVIGPAIRVLGAKDVVMSGLLEPQGPAGDVAELGLCGLSRKQAGSWGLGGARW